MKRSILSLSLITGSLMAGLCLGATAPAQAATSASCHTPAKPLLSQATSLGWQTKELTGAVKKIALKNINAEPPVTHLNPGQLYVTALPPSDDQPAIAMLIFADKDCVTDIAGPMLMTDLVASLAGQTEPGQSP